MTGKNKFENDDGGNSGNSLTVFCLQAQRREFHVLTSVDVADLIATAPRLFEQTVF